MLRKEDARFLRGQGNYLDDIQLPGMLHGAILRSPYAHARIVSIDTSAAEAHPKVKAVITGAVARDAQPGLDADAVATTCRPCSPPTRSASRARRSPSSSPRTATRPATRSS